MADGTAVAAAYMGNKTIEVLDLPVPELRPGEVEISPAYTGICGTDLHILHGAMDARVTLPAVLGHEMSGTIAAIGAGVDGWSVGERVTVMPLAPCGECPACRAGHSHICHNLDFLGIDSPGSMQSRWTVPRDVLGAGRALARARRARRADRGGGPRRAEPSGPTVRRALVVGGGPIGLLVARGGARCAAAMSSSSSPPNGPTRTRARGRDYARSTRGPCRCGRIASRTGPMARGGRRSRSRSRVRSPASRPRSSRWGCAGRVVRRRDPPRSQPRG